MAFRKLRLAEPLLRALATEGYSTPTPIQAQAIPPVLDGRDVLGCAQTGTGKTAAFALPILQRLFPEVVADTASNGNAHGHGHSTGSRKARCLVLCPTRELAAQIGDSFRTYGRHTPLKLALVFGGVGERPQIDALKRGVEVIVATPGRLLDLMNQGHVDLRSIEVLVLDEADRMLDMGFIHDIRRIVAKLPPRRQTLLFSATMPPEIRKLAETLLRDPTTVQVAPAATTAAGIDESVYFVDRANKPALLAHLVNHLPMTRAIVFTRTKHGADRVVRALHTRGIRAEAIHGNKSQNARTRALENFKTNRLPVLVATDIASRGIDVDGITHVVNYDLTHEPETYVHRIGRTARAGAAGAAVSFCDRDERPNLTAIQKLIGRKIPVRDEHPVYANANAAGSSSHKSQHQPQRNQPRREPQHVTGGGVRPKQSSGRAPHSPNTGGDQRAPREAGQQHSSANRQPSSHPNAAQRHAPQRPAAHADVRRGNERRSSSAGSSHNAGGSHQRSRPFGFGRPSSGGQPRRGGPGRRGR